MPSANEFLQDRTLTHATYLLRIQAGQRQAVFRQLSALEVDLIRQLETANLTSFRKDRVDRLLKLVQTTIRAHYRGIRDSQATELIDLADLENTWVQRMLNSSFSVALPVTVTVVDIAITPQFLKSVVSNVMVDNELLSSFWAKQAGELRGRIADAIRLGLLKGETTPDIVKKIRGSRSLNYSDGIMNLARARAQGLVRTAIAATTNDMRMAIYTANQDLISALLQISTLDSKTSLQCIGYSGKQWTADLKIPIGHNLPFNNGVPRHINCRSIITPITRSWDALGGRPIKQLDNKTLEEKFRQELRDLGWDEARVQRAGLNVRSSMDGDAPATTTFQQFLTKKGSAFQDEILGPIRAMLFRSGRLTNLDQLLDMSGRPLSIHQLRQQYGFLT